MTTQALEAPPASDDTIINALINAHGSVALAAERLDVQPDAIVSRLPSLPYEQLLAGIRVARLLKIYDALTVVQDVVVNTLDHLSPEGRVKLLTQLSDRLDNQVLPPVQVPSESGSGPNFQFNFGSREEQEDARVELAKRIVNIDEGFTRAPVEANAGQAN